MTTALAWPTIYLTERKKPSIVIAASKCPAGAAPKWRHGAAP